MEKKTAEEIAIQMYCDRNNFHEVKDTPDGRRIIARSEFIKGVVAGIEYSSLQSEEKDKEIDNLQRIIKEEREIRQRHEVTLSKMLAKQRDEIERLREACKIVVDGYEGDGMEQMQTRDHVFYEKCKKALSNQPIESDKIMKEEKQNGYAPINITQAEEIEAKDRRIKELEEAFENLIDAILDS